MNMSKINNASIPLNVERLDREKVKEMTGGYELMTTFYEDFSLAEPFGKEAIKDTYNRALNEWKHDYKYITELYMILNWKIWRMHEKNNQDFARLYYDLWVDLEKWVDNNFNDEEIRYFYRTTD